MPTITESELTQFAHQLLAACGFNSDEARLVSQSLVGANLRGYDSHGVMRIPQYQQLIDSGAANSGTDLKVLTESASHLVTDGHWGIGQVQAHRLLDQLIEKAQGVGLAIGTMFHCGHIGRLGEYCERAAQQDLVSMVMVNSHGAVVRMAPPGGAAPRLSTNPLAFGAPHQDTPLIADFSTSATAEGKVRVKKFANESVPDGWLINANGEPTNDPNDLYADPPGSIVPMGGDQSYKGFALGLMIEILTGALSGGIVAKEEKFPKLGNCVYMMILNPASFGGLAHFQNEVAQLIEYVRSCPTAPGYSSITLPGDPERDCLARLSDSGIHLDEGNWQKLVELANQLDVSVPSDGISNV